jgi:hypothetical protein
MGNSTGIADAGNSVTDYNHVFIKDCLGIDLLFMGGSRHAIQNAVVLSSAHTVVSLSNETAGKANATCTLLLDNVFVRRDAPPAEVRIGKGGVLEAQHVTTLGCNILAADGEITLHDTIFGVAPDRNGMFPSGRGAKAAELLKSLTPRKESL